MGFFLGGHKNRAGFARRNRPENSKGQLTELLLQLEATCGWYNLLLKVGHKSKEFFLQVMPLLAFQYLVHRLEIFGYPTGENLRTISKDRIPGFRRLKSELHDTWGPFFDDKLEIGCLLT